MPDLSPNEQRAVDAALHVYQRTNLDDHHELRAATSDLTNTIEGDVVIAYMALMLLSRQPEIDRLEAEIRMLKCAHHFNNDLLCIRCGLKVETAYDSTLLAKPVTTEPAQIRPVPDYSEEVLTEEGQAYEQRRAEAGRAGAVWVLMNGQWAKIDAALKEGA